MSVLHLDYETRSVVDLEVVGADNYVRHPSTSILLAAYAFEENKPKLWQPHLHPEIPEDLEDALQDCFCEVHAWNSSFERNVTKFLLGIDKPTEEWRDPMIMARYLGLPGKLEAAGSLLGLRPDQLKLGIGDRLINLFCYPEDEGGEETLFGMSKPTFRDYRTDPKDWELFCKYNKQDVVAERSCENKMSKFLPPEEEWETWRLDQKINATGWPVDRLTVDGAREIALRERVPLLAQIRNISGIDNPNSRSQMLEWLQTQNYTFSSLGKDFVARAMAGECDLTEDAKKVLDLRTQTSKSSVSKYTALADMTSPDGRLRNQYTFYGAHTGRWAAHGANVGNFPKPTKDVEKRLDLAVDLVRKMDYDGIVREFGKPLEVASSVLRSAFRAPEGYKFVVADLNAIENRGLGYIARCDEILRVFREKRDPYLSFAVQMYGDTYENLMAEYKAGDKTKRTICKAPVLGGGYQLGPGDEKIDQETGMVFYTGLMGYARKMGIEMSHQDAVLSIQVLRESWKEVKWLWKDTEQAAVFAIRHPGTIVGVGVPQTKREIEYFESIGRKIYDPIASFKCHSDKLLEFLLPSGRSLFYWSPRVEVVKKTWKGREYNQDMIYYKSRDQKTKQWVETDTFGGHLVENWDQAVSRDVLVHGMKLADKMGFEIVGTTYDEIIALTRLDSGLGVKELVQCMSVQPYWTNGEFPLDAAGFEDIIYRKD
jgi:DNA polymerase